MRMGFCRLVFAEQLKEKKEIKCSDPREHSVAQSLPETAAVIA